MLHIFRVILAILSFLNAECLAFEYEHGYSPFGKLKYPADFESFDYVNKNAPKGGSIKFATVWNFNSLNPFVIGGVAEPNIKQTFATLMMRSLDEPKSQYGFVAEKMEIESDNSAVIYTIRKEARFHDGTPITAEDCAFTIDVLKESGSPLYKLALADIESVEVISDHEVRYNIKNPGNLMVFFTIGEMPILSKRFFADKKFSNHTRDPILGSGPYRVKEVKFGKHINYERVKDYWGENLPSMRGMYNFDEEEYQVYLDQTVAITAFKAGEYDYREENASRVWAREYDVKNMKNGKLKKVTQSHKSAASFQTKILNLRKPDFADRNFRMALEYAYDFDWINKYLLYGIYKRIGSHFEGSQFKATNLPVGLELEILNRYRDQVPQEVFTEEYKNPTTDADPFRARINLEKAKALLMESGYKLVNGKMISPYTKKPVVIEDLIYQSTQERIENKITRDLAKLGIEVRQKRVDYAQYQQRLQDFDFDMATVNFSTTIIPGARQKSFYSSSEGKKAGGLNYGGIDNPVVDSLLSSLVNASSMDEIEAYSKALDRVMLWNYYSIPQVYSSNFRYLYWNKFGIPDVKPDYDIGVETWWSKSY